MPGVKSVLRTVPATKLKSKKASLEGLAFLLFRFM